jgi:hypothetical protein
MKDIKQILEKYYKGETSEDEEKLLRNFFLEKGFILRQAQDDRIRQAQDDRIRKEKDNISENLITNYELRITNDNTLKESDFQIEQIMFDFFESERNTGLDTEFDEKFILGISEQKVKNINSPLKTFYYRFASIAAMLLIAIGMYLLFFNKETETKKKTLTLTEQEKITLEHTLDALTLMSDYMNLASEQMEKLSIINSSLETIKQATNIEDYNNYIFNILGEES